MESIAFLFRIETSTTSMSVREVCEGLWKVLGKKVEHVTRNTLIKTEIIIIIDGTIHVVDTNGKAMAAYGKGL